MKIKRCKIWFAVICLVTVAVLAGLAGACTEPAPTPAPSPAPVSAPTPTQAPSPAPENIELKLAFPYPPGDEIIIGPEFMAQEMEKRTGGRVKITIFPGGSLGPMPDSLDLLETGMADISVFPPSMFPKVCRILDAMTLPSFRIPNRWLAQEIVYTLYYEGLLEKEYAGFKPLLWEGTETSCFAFKEKITTIEGIQKLKMRSPGGLEAKVVESLGVSVVSIPITEVYMALDRGVADGLKAMPGSFLSFKLQEIVKYWLWMPLGSGANVVLMTQEKWDSLPPDIQVIWEQVNNEAKYYFLKEMNARVPDSIGQLENAGLEVYKISPEEEARWYALFEPLTEEWMANAEADGYPAKEAADTIHRTIRRYMEQ